MADLTPEQIKLEQQRLELIREQNEAAKDLVSTYEKQKKTAEGINDDEREVLNISKQLYKVTSDIDKSINSRLSGTASVKDLTKQLNSLTLNQLNNNGELNKLQTELNKKLDLSHQLKQEGVVLNKKQENAEEAAGQKASRVANLQRTINNYQERILDAQLRQDRGEITKLTNLKARAILARNNASQQEKDYKQNLKDANEEVILNKQKYDIANSQSKILQENLENYEKVTDEQKKEQDLLKQAIIQKKKSDALDAIKDKFNVKQISDMFTLAGIIKMIIDGALRFNAISVNIGKNFGYGADQANRVTSNLKDIAQSSNNVNVTLASAAEAMSQIGEATGFVKEYSADALETQIMLTKQFGLSAEAASDIYKFSVLTGQSSKEVNDQMVGAFVATRNQLGVGVPFKATMEEAAKVSGQLAANLKNNPGAIVAAVVQMKALGTTLEDTKAQGESLLNFESSIENELKAELLTGQQMNLEKARAAALMGDQVTLAQELSNQGMTLEKFSSMNVLAQNAFSAAVGLSSDKLAEQLKRQKLAVDSGKSYAEITAEEAKKAEERQNIQDKFNAAVLKLQDFFGNLVAGPLGSFLDILSKALPLITSIATVFGTIYTIQKAAVMLESLKLGFQVAYASSKVGELTTQGALNIAKGEELATQIGIAAAWAIANPIPALAGLLIAGGIGAAVYSQMSDGVIGPGAETIVSGPEGSIQLNKNDSLIAGTDLFGGKKESMASPSLDLTPMIAAINSVKASVDRLYSKDTSINMDGKKVGTTLTQSSYKVA
jgi:hypothetical protein